MFSYSDPAGRSFLSNDATVELFQSLMQGFYDMFARRPDSGFTWIEAFQQLSGGLAPAQPSVDWLAFPITAQATDKQIDKDRFAHQDEYVEWRAETTQNKLNKVTFTTEFPEYLQTFAAVGLDALVLAIQDIIPGANPTADDLFGPGFNPSSTTPTGRSQTFRDRLASNPWNNGQKGILCLTQPFNTLNALFNLLAECGVARTQGTPEIMCSIVAPTGACGPGRQSDPAVCATAQRAARDKVGFTLRDPAGVRILKLEGVWKINNAVIDVNDVTQNQGVWIVSRNGRRGILTVVQGLTIDGETPVSGAQVSKKLRVAADLLATPESSLPPWARSGDESDSRGPPEA